MIRLMVADDDVLVVEGIRSIIDWERYNIELTGEAYDGQEAYNKALELRPDYILSDIVMPGFTGLELMERFYKKAYCPDFIFITGYAEFKYVQKALKLGAFDYLLKPLEKEELVELAERMKEKYDIMNGSNGNDDDKSDIIPVSDNRILNMMLEYLRENLYEHIKLYDVAEKFHFNSSYIGQLFKRELGISFSEYITRLRLNHAEKLLRETDLPIKDICIKVGIGDYFYFNKLFKRYKNVTPAQIRS